MKQEIHTLGQWYLREDTQEVFQVIDHDERSGTTRVQMFDGSLDEFELETWRALSPVPTAPPEDWTGPLDVEAEDTEGWGAEEQEETSVEGLRIDREPWEDIVAEELLDPYGQAVQEETEPEGWVSRAHPFQERISLRG